MKLSVIIPCFNASKTLSEQLNALTLQEVAPWEVIIVDNGSTDDSLMIAHQYYNRLPNLKVLSATELQGAAYARNTGAIAATGDAIAFCDADDVVDRFWTKALSEALRCHDFVASCHEVKKLNGAAATGSQGQTLQQFNPLFLPHAGGCGIAVKRTIHLQVGGFDETMPHLEDTEYCLRVQLAGFSLQFVPEAVIHIRQKKTYTGFYQQGFNWGKSFVLLYKKHQHRMTKFSWFTVFKQWAGFIWWSLRAVVQGKRDSVWQWSLGWRMGLLAGCINYQVSIPRADLWQSTEEIPSSPTQLVKTIAAS